MGRSPEIQHISFDSTTRLEALEERKDTHCNAAFRCGGAGRMDHDGDF
jgi:hypothetical protein